ncbi:hypothetical protein, partial [Acinetobacter baumannii]|uniref:hypothetical protein n=1 Tax=Acinetobacter baumannii TaxID=470 RepID=UPI001EF0A636
GTDRPGHGPAVFQSVGGTAVAVAISAARRPQFCAAIERSHCGSSHAGTGRRLVRCAADIGNARRLPELVRVGVVAGGGEFFCGTTNLMAAAATSAGIEATQCGGC